MTGRDPSTWTREEWASLEADLADLERESWPPRCGCSHLHTGHCPTPGCGCRHPHPLETPGRTSQQ